MERERIRKEKNFFYLFPTLKPDVIFSSLSLSLALALSLYLAPTEGPSAALSMNLDRAKTRLAVPEKFHPLIYQEQKFFPKL